VGKRGSQGNPNGAITHRPLGRSPGWWAAFPPGFQSLFGGRFLPSARSGADRRTSCRRPRTRCARLRRHCTWRLRLPRSPRHLAHCDRQPVRGSVRRRFARRMRARKFVPGPLESTPVIAGQTRVCDGVLKSTSFACGARTMSAGGAATTYGTEHALTEVHDA
jgi:hypothetical protein